MREREGPSAKRWEGEGCRKRASSFSIPSPGARAARATLSRDAGEGKGYASVRIHFTLRTPRNKYPLRPPRNVRAHSVYLSFVPAGSPALLRRAQVEFEGPGGARLLVQEDEGIDDAVDADQAVLADAIDHLR